MQAHFIIPILLFGMAICHSTKYQIDRNETCFNPEPAKIYSWHIHLLYWQTNEDHTKGAYDIRDKFIAKFKGRLGPECTDLFHQSKMCMFEPDIQPVGPFLTAQWSVFLTMDDFADTVPWIMQHRGDYDILVHPNSGCELEDHSWWAFWGGNPWEINMGAFSMDYPFPWPEKRTNKDLLESNETSFLVKSYIKEHEE
jgi:aromatic ring-cleaving dioxygenase